MQIPAKGSSAKTVHAWLCHGADVDGTGGEQCNADDLHARPQAHDVDEARLDALLAVGPGLPDDGAVVEKGATW